MPYRDLNKRKEYHKRYLKNRYHKRRKEAINLLGGKCSSCGVLDNLHFDHINPKTKKFEISDKIRNWKWERILKELEKCQLLCITCHRKKCSTEQKRNHEHGSRHMYRTCGCRCDLCKEYSKKGRG